MDLEITARTGEPGYEKKTNKLTHCIKVFQTAIATKVRSTSKDIAEWSTGDVVKWLQRINLNEIVQNVINAKLDGAKIMTLTEEEVCSGLDLATELTELLTKELKWLKITVQVHKPYDTDVPEEFLCPITQDIMRDPVTCSDGFTYDSNAIAEWFMSGKFTSPMTNDVLTNTDFTRNLALRDSITHFLDSLQH